MTALLLATWLLGCGGPSSPPPAPPAPPPPAEAIVGTWRLEGLDADRLAAWAATVEGAPAPAHDDVAAWLAAHRDAPDAARVRAELAANAALRMEITADRLRVVRGDRVDEVGWTAVKQGADAEGRPTVRLETRDAQGAVRQIDVRFDDPDHVVLDPKLQAEPSRWARVTE